MRTLLLPHILWSYWSNSFVCWITDLGSFWIWWWSVFSLVSWRWFFFALKSQPSSVCCWMAWNSSFWRWRSDDFFGTKFHFVKAENICACFAVSAIKCTQLKLLDHQFRCSCVEQQCLPHSWRARYFKSLLKLINHNRRMHSRPPRSLECTLC
jgi:hypothetical protein